MELVNLIIRSTKQCCAAAVLWQLIDRMRTWHNQLNFFPHVILHVQHLHPSILPPLMLTYGNYDQFQKKSFQACSLWCFNARSRPIFPTWREEVCTTSLFIRTKIVARYPASLFLQAGPTTATDEILSTHTCYFIHVQFIILIVDIWQIKMGKKMRSKWRKGWSDRVEK